MGKCVAVGILTLLAFFTASAAWAKVDEGAWLAMRMEALAASPPAKPGKDLTRAKKMLESFLPRFKQKARSVLDPEERAVFDAIEFEVPLDRLAISLGVNDGRGRRKVVITPGMSLALGSISYAMVVEDGLGYTGCQEDYFPYFFKGVAANFKRAINDEPLRLILPPYAFGKKWKNRCSGFTPDMIRKNERLLKRWAALELNSLYLVYLHEIAHHIQGIRRMEKLALADRRRLELEADVWAVKKMALSNTPPMMSLPFWIFAMGMNGGTLEQEAGATHPLGERRFLLILQEAFLSDAAFLRALKQSGRGKQVYDWIRELEKRFSGAGP